MSRRLGSSILLTLVGLVVISAFSLSTGPSAKAGAPPALAPDGNRSTTQQHAPAQPFGSGGWTLMAALPGVTVPLPDEEIYAAKPARIKRGGAALYPPNGKIYLMGGRMGLDGTDNPISFNGMSGSPPYTWIFEYTPGSPGTWTRKQADMDPCPAPLSSSAPCPGERFTSNMAVATLTDTTGVAIYAVGGSNVSSVPTNKVRRYDPVGDAITYITSDPWPANPSRIPGGYAVLNNKLYIFGGFDPRGNGTVYGDTWVFDPMAAAGSRWSHPATANLSTPRAYIAGAALDGYIYAIGGDTWQTNPNIELRKLVPSSVVERMDPLIALPSWQPVASLPQPKGDAGAWAYDPGTGYGISGKLVVAGGHSNPPDASNYLVPNASAYILDPPSLSDADGAWTSFIGLTNPTRNFGVAALNGFLYAIGGYDYSSGAPEAAGFTQRFDATGDIATTTPVPTSTNTSTPSNTASSTPSRTATPLCNCTPTATATHTAGASTSTSTSVGTSTGTPPATSTGQPTSTPTAPGPPSATPTCVCAATPTATACTIEFADVDPGSTFYPFVRCLACQGIVGGYPCGGPDEPCGPGEDPYYRPGSNITRGQIAKIVSESAGLHDDQDEQFYEDVPPGSTFYVWINRLSWRGYMGGYACNNDPTQPCGPGNLPYFRPNANATRGQLSKIVANAALIDDPVSGQTYQDVPPSIDSDSFYTYIERLTARNVMGGYACGTTGPNSGPCDDQDRPYFRPNNPVTRGQAAKIVANTFFPNCQTP